MYKVKTSVRSLVETILTTGDLGGDGSFMSLDRAMEGSRVHRLHQKMREEEKKDYKKEVFLREVFLRDEIEVTVEGRADGILENEYIEEIKSTYRNLDELEEDYNMVHWAQVKFYGYIYLKQNDLDSIVLKLTYFKIDTEEFISFDKEFTMEELESFVNDVLEVFCRLKMLFFRWQEKRNKSIKVTNFPFSEYRMGQRNMAVNIFNTIKEGKKIFVQAPTGIGKTISTLFPSIKALNEGLIDKIFYLTPKSTGKKIGEESVDIMRKSGAKLRSITLTSKEKICFMEEVKCEADYCPYARGYYDRQIEALIDILENEDSIDREVIERYARAHTICPFEFSLDLSIYADVIIGDYNYVFDPRVYLRRFFDEKTGKYVFLIDEAHNLLDRARSMFSVEVKLSHYLKVSRDFRLENKEISKSAMDVANYLEVLYEKIKEDTREAKSSYDKTLSDYILIFSEKVIAYLSDEKNYKEREEFKRANKEDFDYMLEVFFEATNFNKIVEVYNEGHIAYSIIEGEDIKYKIFNIDPSLSLKSTYDRADSIVFFSATLSPIDYYMNLYGADEKDYRMSLPSPFNKENLEVFLDLDVKTKYKQRDSSYGKIVENLKLMVERKKGNYIVFFPSYKYMEKVYELFNDSYGDICELGIQESGLSEVARQEVIDSFNKIRDKSYLYFMVLGGVFSEGIDLKGDSLIGTALVGLGYPMFDYERELITEYFQDKMNEGFNYAYTYPGLNKITQAGGRVIRSENDKGIILLMDDRYRDQNIRRLLPENWFPLKSKELMVKNGKE